MSFRHTSAVLAASAAVLGNWPNWLDVAPPKGTAVKTFGLQECNVDYTGCTSVFGNYANSPSGSEKIRGRVVPYSAFQSLGSTPNNEGNTTFGTAKNRLVTITTNTTAATVYVYNANNTATASASPRLLPSSNDGTPLTFQPIVWTLTAPTSQHTNVARSERNRPVLGRPWIRAVLLRKISNTPKEYPAVANH